MSLEKPFISAPSPVVSLDPSSGDPNAYKDPNSIASMGLHLQSLNDQVKADTHYDTPAPERKKLEAFENACTGARFMTSDAATNEWYRAEGYDCYQANLNSANSEACGIKQVKQSWISNTNSCQNPAQSMGGLEGFKYSSYSFLKDPNTCSTACVVGLVAAGLIAYSFIRK